MIVSLHLCPLGMGELVTHFMGNCEVTVSTPTMDINAEWELGVHVGSDLMEFTGLGGRHCLRVRFHRPMSWATIDARLDLGKYGFAPLMIQKKIDWVCVRRSVFLKSGLHKICVLNPNLLEFGR